VVGPYLDSFVVKEMPAKSEKMKNTANTREVSIQRHHT
jgi:hypothetical protein